MSTHHIALRCPLTPSHVYPVTLSTILPPYHPVRPVALSLSPCHPVTLSPCHTINSVTLSPCHSVNVLSTLSSCRFVTLLILSTLSILHPLNPTTIPQHPFPCPDQYRAKLNYLGEVHSLRGVKATEYGIVGEVMFWTLGKVLGPAYTPEVHNAWVKIFSSMMKVIVPIAVAHELRDNTSQRVRLEKARDQGAEIGLYYESPGQRVAAATGTAGKCPY